MDEYAITKLTYERYAANTTTMSKMNPGWYGALPSLAANTLATTAMFKMSSGWYGALPSLAANTPRNYRHV
jgi:hypothetical protein